jgi:putative SOS response-associated peptidase YedK
MCYSSSLTSKNIDLSKKYKREIPSEIAEAPLFHASAFSFPELKIISSEPEIQVMNWGLVPHWFSGTDTSEIASMTINARCETILEKASFKHLIGRQHCIVPSNGFFEYQHVGKERIPWFVYPANDTLFSMAGVYDQYKNPFTGIVSRTFSIITCAANDIMAEIHNTKKRMPVMLRDDQLEGWLCAKSNEIGDFLLTSPNEMIAARKINPKIVNGPNHNSPEVQLEFVDPRGVQGSLF